LQLFEQIVFADDKFHGVLPPGDRPLTLRIFSGSEEGREIKKLYRKDLLLQSTKRGSKRLFWKDLRALKPVDNLRANRARSRPLPGPARAVHSRPQPAPVGGCGIAPQQAGRGSCPRCFHLSSRDLRLSSLRADGKHLGHPRPACRGSGVGGMPRKASDRAKRRACPSKRDRGARHPADAPTLRAALPGDGAIATGRSAC